MKINLSTVSSNIRIFTTVVFALVCVTPGVAQSQPASTEPAVSQSKGSGQAFPTRAMRRHQIFRPRTSQGSRDSR